MRRIHSCYGSTLSTCVADTPLLGSYKIPSTTVQGSLATARVPMSQQARLQRGHVDDVLTNADWKSSRHTYKHTRKSRSSFLVALSIRPFAHLTRRRLKIWRTVYIRHFLHYDGRW
jgi:hypothetical protein